MRALGSNRLLALGVYLQLAGALARDERNVTDDNSVFSESRKGLSNYSSETGTEAFKRQSCSSGYNYCSSMPSRLQTSYDYTDTERSRILLSR